MIVSTTFEIAGHDILEYRGIARGIIVRSPTIGQSFLGNIKNLVGGNIPAFAEMCETGRQQAYDVMLRNAQLLGANAILGMRYDAAEVAVDRFSATEVLCYGTAVIIQPKKATSV